jgi:hypothetical protein
MSSLFQKITGSLKLDMQENKSGILSGEIIFRLVRQQ